MQPDASRPSELIYGLDDRPQPLPALLAALQHAVSYTHLTLPTIYSV